MLHRTTRFKKIINCSWRENPKHNSPYAVIGYTAGYPLLIIITTVFSSTKS